MADRTRLTNRLTALRKTYFPQALEWAGDWRQPAAGEFLLAWPTLEALQRASRAKRRGLYDRHRRLSTEEREDLFRQVDQALPLTRDPALVEASALMAQGLAEQLSTVIAVIARLEHELEKLFSQHADRDLFDGLPGAGDALAGVWPPPSVRTVTATRAPRTSRNSPASLRSPRGAARPPWCSGDSLVRNSCARRFRSSPTSRKKSLRARAYHEQQRKRGADHHAAVCRKCDWSP